MRHARPLQRLISRTLIAAIAALLLASAWLKAQSVAVGGEPTIDAAFRARTVDQIGEALEARYVFPDVATKCAQRLRERRDARAYDQITGAIAFADILTRDLQSISNDKHMRVRARPPSDEAPSAASEEPTPEQVHEMRERMRDQMRKGNFGFQKLEHLDGNVGYLDLRGFVPAEIGGDTAVAAMNYLSNSDAIIIDLRNNGGGSPDMIQLISTYFFDEPTLLNTMYWREGDRTDQFWTLPHVPGSRMPDTPLFVLMSNRTFSGAEEFAYNMKNLKRATLIGETTGGGAHPGGNVPINELIGMFIPVGRAINPISHTNWEGMGVEPDIQVPAGDALTLAHAKAIENLLAAVTDPMEKSSLEWAKFSLDTSLKPVPAPSAADLKRFAGTYGLRRVWVENGQLMYQREGMPVRTLAPMTADTFTMDGAPYFRARFESDAGGKVVRLVGLYDDGRAERSERTGD